MFKPHAEIFFSHRDSGLVQQRVAGSGGVPPSPKLPTRVRFGNFGYTKTMAKIARCARSFGHRAPGSTRSCPLPLAALATSAISGFASLTAFAKSLRQENASIF